MSETVEPTQKKITVFFERAFKEFGAGSSASIHVETGVSADDDENTQLTAVREAFALAKRAVFEQLGVEYAALAQDDETFLLTEHQAVAAVKRAFPGTTEVPTETPTGRIVDMGGSVTIKKWDGSRYVADERPIPDWLPAAAAAKGVTEVAFNKNSETNPKAPVFKEIGKGKDGEAFWAPKEKPRGASSAPLDQEPF